MAWLVMSWLGLAWLSTQHAHPHVVTAARLALCALQSMANRQAMSMLELRMTLLLQHQMKLAVHDEWLQTGGGHSVVGACLVLKV